MNDIDDRFSAQRLIRLSPRWWLVFGAALLLWKLNYAPLWNPDEGRYAAASLEMAHPFGNEVADWVVPHLNTIPRVNKPPFIYWLAATSFRAFGVSEDSGRLVSALAAIAIMLMLWQAGTLIFGESTGICGALIWVTTVFPFAMARVLNTDMLLTATMCLALLAMWAALENCVTGSLSFGWRPCLWAGLGLGLALLTKGPFGLAFPLLTYGIYCFIALRNCDVRWKRAAWALVISLLVALLVALPWYLAIESRRPGFLMQFIVNENLGRFSGSHTYHRQYSPLYYIPVVVGGLFPWSAWLVVLFRNRDTDKNSVAHRGRVLLRVWAVLLILFFSFSKTKLVSYALPAFPPLALLIGDALMQLGAARSGRRTLLFVARATVIFSLVILVAAATYLLGDKTMPRNAAQPFLVALFCTMTLSSVCCLYYAKKGGWHWFCAQVLTTSTMFAVIVALAGSVAQYEDTSLMLRQLKPYLQPGDVVVEYRVFHPAAMFYTQRAVPIVDFPNNSGLDENDPSFRSLYIKQSQLEPILKRAPRWYLLTKRQYTDVFTRFGTTFLVGRTNGSMLISNRIAPPGYHYNFVAPRKEIVRVPRVSGG